MDFKKKIKTLLQKEGLQKVQNVFKPNPAETLFPPVKIQSVSRDSETEIRSHPSDPEADEAVLKTIEPVFFTSDSFDPSLHVLQQLPAEVDIEELAKSRQRLLKELTVVSKKVFQLILEKQSSYTGEIQRVREIEDDLVAAIFTCQAGREDLALTKDQFTSKSLGILANYRKRQNLTELLSSLRTIHTLQKTELRLQEMLKEDDYPGAIQLLLECQQAAVTYSHFTCISDLSKKLQVTLENAEEQLDVALSKICSHFDEKHYSKLQKAYQLLGKTHTCVDQLLMHYASAIHNTAFSVIHGFAELCRPEDQPVNLQKKQYQDLCACLSSEIFIPCLVDLCKSMWKIVLSYHKLLAWHLTETNKSETESQEDKDINQEYVDQKLQNGSSRIWQDIQTKVKVFLLACDFTGFKVDDFMQVLSIVHNLKRVGREFCNSESESLRDCLREASLRYFLRYHYTKLEELRIFIENEGWEVCPVRSDFDIHQLQEFKFLKNYTNTINMSTSTQIQDCKFNFEEFDESGSPFEILKETSEENIYATKDKSSTSSRRRSRSPDGMEGQRSSSNSTEEEEEEDDGNPPIITNSSLTILRLFGRYLHLMHLLNSIAYDVAVCMSQLFEYYFYSVFVFFGSENGEVTIEAISNAQLRVALSRIHERLIKDESDSNNGNGKIPPPLVSPILNLTSEEELYGLSARVVGSESAIYLALQLDSLKRFIESHLPESNWDSIAQLIDQAVIVSEGLRKLTFAGVSCKAVDYQSVVNTMEKVNWEVKELMSQHSSYVDILLRGLQIFSMRVEAVSARVVIPEQVHAIIWEQIFRFCCRAFVDGFSNAKKCSNSGRGLMQLDFTQFLSKIGQLSPISLKGLVDREYVESYVKAYYMPEGIMEEWIQNHPEYSSKQLISLINCAWQGNKKSKQRLQAIVEELDKAKR